MLWEKRSQELCVADSIPTRAPCHIHCIAQSEYDGDTISTLLADIFWFNTVKPNSTDPVGSLSVHPHHAVGLSQRKHLFQWNNHDGTVF